MKFHITKQDTTTNPGLLGIELETGQLYEVVDLRDSCLKVGDKVLVLESIINDHDRLLDLKRGEIYNDCGHSIWYKHIPATSITIYIE